MLATIFFLQTAAVASGAVDTRGYAPAPAPNQQLAKVKPVTPSDDLPSLLANASDGDVFELADGSYHYECCSSGVQAMLELKTGGVSVRAKNAGQAVLDGMRAARVVYVSAAGRPVVLDGLNITGGNAHDGAGGGLLIRGARIAVSNTHIYSNAARLSGAGMHVEGSAAHVDVVHTSIQYNTAEATGGAGIAIFGGTVTLEHCAIHDNTAHYGTYLPGAGLYVSGAARVSLTNTRIFYNTASDGGGVAIDSGNVSFKGCDVYDNQGSRAGGVYHRRGNVTIDHSTAIYDNIPSDCEGDPPWTVPACGRRPVYYTYHTLRTGSV